MAVAMVRRNCLWFGTIERSNWFQTPNSGADTSPSGWNSEGTLLNGGASVFSSWGSAKNYVFEWSNSSAPEVSQKMKSYADGSYGRGLLYFQIPNTYETNVLPAAVADPSMAIGYEGNSLVYGIEPTSLPTSASVNDLPVAGATYSLLGIAAGFRGTAEAIYVPIPEGYTLMLGAFYASSGTGGVFVTEQLNTGGTGATTRLTQLATNATNIVPNAISNVPGVWLWIGRTSTATSSVSIQGLIGRLIETERYDTNHPDRARLQRGPWIGGQGNSGCRFVGKPSYVEYGPGRVGFACTLREVGLWSNG